VLAVAVGAFLSSLAYRWGRESMIGRQLPAAARSGDRSAPESGGPAARGVGIKAEGYGAGGELKEREPPAGLGRGGEARGGAVGAAPRGARTADFAGELADGAALVPPGERARIRIEVLNGARVPGLADRVTNLLRDQGYDVVNYGNAPGARHATTSIIDRVGKPRYAREVALALPGSPIRTDLAPDGFIDVTVILGADFERFFQRREAPPPPDAEPRGWLSRVRETLGF
jgi:hypothetical protein